MKRILVIFTVSILFGVLISCGSFNNDSDILKRAGTQQPQKPNNVAQWTSKKKQNESTFASDTKTFSPTDNLINTETPINNQAQEEYISYVSPVKIDNYEPESFFVPTQEEKEEDNLSIIIQSEESIILPMNGISNILDIPSYPTNEYEYKYTDYNEHTDVPLQKQENSVVDIINAIGVDNNQTEKPIISDLNTSHQIEHEITPRTQISLEEDFVDNSKVMLLIILGAIFLIGIAIAYYCILLKKRNID